MTQSCTPPDPTKAGAHWLSGEDETFVALWREHADLGFLWYRFRGGEYAERVFLNGYRYLRPVITPEQEDTLHAEIDEMAAVLNAANESTIATWKGTRDLRRGIVKALWSRDDMRPLPDDHVLVATIEEIRAANRNLAHDRNAMSEKLQAAEATIEELRAERTRLTTALDERASETQDADWRAM